MSKLPTSRARMRSRGFTLVEMMVACALGLFVALAVVSAMVSSGRQFSIISGNATAQHNAQVGLSLLDAAARNAGAGFYSNSQPVCPTWNAWNGTSMVSDGLRFMPVRVIDGGTPGASDTVVFTGATGSGALSAGPVMTDTTSAANVRISNSGGFRAGDYAVIGAPSSDQPCTLFQVTDAPTATPACGGNAHSCLVLIRTPNTGLNPGPTTFTTRPTFGFATGGGAFGPAVVNRVGSTADGFRQDAFAIQCGALVRYNAFRTAALPGCATDPLNFAAGVDAIATEIVLMHVQYGVSASAASDVVAEWVNASGVWAGTPAASDIARIKSVRLVLVARSAEPDGSEVSSPCTNGAGVANTGPCSFEDAQAPVIDLGAMPLPAGRSWRNYRYRVHTVVLPLRSVIWSD